MLNLNEAVLVLVDFQGRLVDMVDRSERVIPNILNLIRGCQAVAAPILATVQVPEKLGMLHPDFAEALGQEAPIAKTAFSAMREPQFVSALHSLGRKQIILTGIEAHVCVLQTGLDLLETGFTVHIVQDGVFSRTGENHDLALRRIQEAGGSVTSVETALFELIRTSQHPAFRTIAGLIK